MRNYKLTGLGFFACGWDCGGGAAAVFTGGVVVVVVLGLEFALDLDFCFGFRNPSSSSSIFRPENLEGTTVNIAVPHYL